MVGRVYGSGAVGIGRAGFAGRVAVRPWFGGRLSSGTEQLHRACSARRQFDSASQRLGMAGHGELVGRQRDVDARRNSLELLFSTRAVVQIIGTGDVHVDSLRLPDHRVRSAAVIDRNGGA